MTTTQRSLPEGRHAQTTSAAAPSRRTIRRLDVGAALTAAGFLALGYLTWFQLQRLTGLGTSLFDAAAALDQGGRAMSGPARLPIVGPTTGVLADGVQQAASSAQTSATDAMAAIRQLAVLVAVAIALIPMPLLFGAYLPLRRHWVRSVQIDRRS